VRATIELTANRRQVARWLAELYSEEADGEAPPDAAEWFAICVHGLADDELQVATMFLPIKVSHVRILE
jgi:phage terminase Nu1 subunit (DNA packaging protein)